MARLPSVFLSSLRAVSRIELQSKAARRHRMAESVMPSVPVTTPHDSIRLQLNIRLMGIARYKVVNNAKWCCVGVVSARQVCCHPVLMSRGASSRPPLKLSRRECLGAAVLCQAGRYGEERGRDSGCRARRAGDDRHGSRLWRGTVRSAVSLCRSAIRPPRRRTSQPYRQPHHRQGGECGRPLRCRRRMRDHDPRWRACAARKKPPAQVVPGGCFGGCLRVLRAQRSASDSAASPPMSWTHLAGSNRRYPPACPARRSVQR